MRGDFDEDEFEDYELRPGVDYGDTVVEAGSTFDLDDATPLERGLYNMGREVEQLPASALQTRLSLLLSTAMIELWRMRQRFAEHAVQCPQRQGVALGVASTENPPPIRAGDVVYLAGFGLRHVSTPQAAKVLTGNDGVDGIYHCVWRREGSWT
jgi:hypothetical protein